MVYLKKMNICTVFIRLLAIMSVCIWRFLVQCVDDFPEKYDDIIVFEGNHPLDDVRFILNDQLSHRYDMNIVNRIYAYWEALYVEHNKRTANCVTRDYVIGLETDGDIQMFMDVE